MCGVECFSIFFVGQVHQIIISSPVFWEVRSYLMLKHLTIPSNTYVLYVVWRLVDRDVWLQISLQETGVHVQSQAGN